MTRLTKRAAQLAGRVARPPTSAPLPVWIVGRVCFELFPPFGFRLCLRILLLRLVFVHHQVTLFFQVYEMEFANLSIGFDISVVCPRRQQEEQQ